MNKQTRSLMTRTVLSTAIAGAVFALTTGTANAATDYWAAIAISPSTGNVGYTYNSGGAASGAVHKCAARRLCGSLTAAPPSRRHPTARGAGAMRHPRRCGHKAIADTLAAGAHLRGWTCTHNG